MKPTLSKTDFIQFLNCPKSLWLLKNKPELYPVEEFTEYAKKLTAEGDEVERHVKLLIDLQEDANSYFFQTVFDTNDGLFARADMVLKNPDGSIDLFEIKSSTSVKETNPHNQLKDAAFQSIAAQRTGAVVRKFFIVHLNGDYIRDGDVNADELLVFSDVTEKVNAVLSETEEEIVDVLSLLAKEKIDESSCSCLHLSRGHHCNSFGYFNPQLPKPSIYNLPRLSVSKRKLFVGEGRFDLGDIKLDEVSRLQKPVLLSYQSGAPYVDLPDIKNFFEELSYPLYFLDYETYASAIPIVSGAKPQSPIPFQFSLHRLDLDGELTHSEFLAENPEMPLNLVTVLEQSIGEIGSIITWNRSFENTQNKMMATLYPEYGRFLKSVIERTVDLQDVFKTGYVDIRFKGSTSIKKVLPVCVPELSYEGMDISDGTEAMQGWITMLELPRGQEKNDKHRALLEYCKLDTNGMVSLFEFAQRLAMDA